MSVDPDALRAQLESIDTKMSVTHGSYAVQSAASVPDLDWNHMDPHHRQFVHGTYGRSLRLCTGKDFQVSITKYGIWPIFLVVSDVRLRPGLFYQCFSLFGLVTVISVIRSVEQQSGTRQQIDWYILSKRLLKFVHPWLSKRIERLNRIQNEEDKPIRERRCQLRDQGYRFVSDQPDFLVASSLANNVIPPRLEGEHAVAIDAASPATLKSFRVGNLEFLYLSDAAGGLKLWPAVCSHEGGPLEKSLIPATSGRLKCPWHGMEFKGVHLTREQPTGFCGGTRLRLEGSHLLISPES
ncbi:Rieske 2Fe-2S domain-containing protein [Candidatus Nitronereus thalassa]|uniref:Rieske 2Fe-2S domain-containing protein n=1 Tax=Candidatus Nitronereus thalassa TaxID=3020898 RepID=A0ABU3K5J7_9BACT|nr:Rieske 2Fe-2S domain-containing protein [Candidatus Nitronereus thalassa]MDT7041653.1 Rieske 2Fe-2S domain-containing protein [Candidatus Nitronereus thalassa]